MTDDHDIALFAEDRTGPSVMPRRVGAMACFICEAASGVDLHHILFRSQRPDLKDDPQNLVPLCRKCHDAVHTRKWFLSRTEQGLTIGNAEGEVLCAYPAMSLNREALGDSLAIFQEDLTLALAGVGQAQREGAEHLMAYVPYLRTDRALWEEIWGYVHQMGDHAAALKVKLIERMWELSFWLPEEGRYEAIGQVTGYGRKSIQNYRRAAQVFEALAQPVPALSTRALNAIVSADDPKAMLERIERGELPETPFRRKGNVANHEGGCCK